MFKNDNLEELASKLFAILPDNFRAVEEDLQQKFKAVLQSALSHLDVITREEFDVQTKVLQRTREKVEILQQQIEALAKSQSHKKTD